MATAAEYFAANPDVAQAYAENSYGLTPDQFAETHYRLYGQNEQRTAPSVEETALSAASVEAPAATVTDYLGNTYNINELTSLAKELSNVWDFGASSGGAFSTSGENIGFDAKSLQSALGSGKAPTVAEQVAYDMARQLMMSGVNSLSDFDKATARYANLVDAEGSVGGQYAGYDINPNATGGAGALFSAVGPNNTLTFGNTAVGEGATHYQLQRDPVTGQYKVVTGGVSTSDKDMLAFLAKTGLALAGGAGLFDGLVGTGSTALDAAAQEALNAADLYAQTGTLTAADLASQLGVSLEEAANILTSTGGYLNAASVEQLMQQYGKEALDAADAYERAGNLTAKDLADQFGIPVEELIPMLPPDSPLVNALGGGFIGEGVPSGVPEWDQALERVTPAPTVPSVSPTVTPGTPSVTPSTPTTPTGIPKELSGLLTGSNIQNLLKALATYGLTSQATRAFNTGTAGVGALPTQGIPTYGPGYFQAVQQAYNQYMPGTPRDVSGPLEQWYNSKYGS